MCIDRDSKPATCLCGCSLPCGIITNGVFVGLALISSVAAVHLPGIVWNLIVGAPLVALAFAPKNLTVRLINYIWQVIGFIGLLVAVVAWLCFIIFFDMPNWVCSTHSEIKSQLGNESADPLKTCEDIMVGVLYGVWLAFTIIFVPISFLFVSIFKAYYEELKEEQSNEAGY